MLAVVPGTVALAVDAWHPWWTELAVAAGPVVREIVVDAGRPVTRAVNAGLIVWTNVAVATWLHVWIWGVAEPAVVRVPIHVGTETIAPGLTVWASPTVFIKIDTNTLTESAHFTQVPVALDSTTATVVFIGARVHWMAITAGIEPVVAA